MIGGPEIMREFVLALGGAMIVGSVAVLVRERSRKPEDPRPKPNMRFVLLNIVLGTVMAAWGIASMLAAA